MSTIFHFTKMIRTFFLARQRFGTHCKYPLMRANRGTILFWYSFASSLPGAALTSRKCPTRLPNPFTSPRCWFFQGPPWLSLHTTLHHHTCIQEQVGWEPDYTTTQPPWLSLSQQRPLTRNHSGLLFVVAFLND